MLKRFIPVLAAAMLLPLGPAQGNGRDRVPLPRECAIPDSMLNFAEGMHDFVEALRKRKPVTIVALGSSSTQGVGVTSPDLTYPARLQAELMARFPGQQIRVVNRGTGGELASHMVRRLQRDVIDEDPDLVIWQTGTNDALAGVTHQEFSRQLADGIDRLQLAGIDVLLMDLQYYPTVRNPETYTNYVADMVQVAEKEDVPLFRRFAFMRYWSDRQRGTGSTLWAGDRFHLGALGYRCVAAVLAEAIEREVQDSRSSKAALTGAPTDFVAAVGR